MSIHENLKKLNIELPPANPPVGAYVPVKRIGNLLYVSGQLPMKDGKLLAAGQVPSKVSIEQAKSAARQCVLNALAAIQSSQGSLDVITSVIRIGVFVSSDATFTQQSAVANGASELLVDLLGDTGKHARAAVGVNVLPLDATVEVEFIFHRRD